MAKTDTQHNAAIDANKYPTLTVTSGTPGTADTTGTADIVRVGGNPATGAMYVQDLSGASGTTNVSVVNGTINRLHDAGTLGSIANVGVIHTAGTVSALPDLPGGTVDLVTRIGNIGTIESGTVTTTLALNTGTITTIAAGTQNTLGTVGTVIGQGTLSNVGSVNTITTVSNLTNGTVRVSVGTIVVGTMVGQQANAGSLTTNPISVAGTDAGGTLYAFLTDTAGHSKTDVITGTLAAITSVTNLAAGTIQLNQKPINLGTPFTTYGTTNAAVWGTIIAASGAGTKQYVENVDIVVHSGTVDVAITNIGVGGSTGAGVMARGQFPAGGGI